MLSKTTFSIQKRNVMVNGKTYQGFLLTYYDKTGRRIRKSFQTRRDAEAGRKQVEIERERDAILQRQIGMKAEGLTPDDLLDAAKALEILKRAAPLTTAAQYFIDHNPRDGKRPTIAEAVEIFVQSRAAKGCRQVTVKGYRDKLQMLIKDMGERHLHDIRERDIADWLSRRKITKRSTVSYLRHLNSFFQYFVRKRILIENPVQLIDRPAVDKTPITFLTIRDARRLLDTAASEYPELVPYVAIAIFAGLRPTELHGDKSEHGPLDWREIDLDAKIITVTAQQDKLRQGRHVNISDNLIAWLMPFRRQHGPIYYGRTAFNSLCDKSGIPYSKDIMRHTTATYHYAMHQNDGLTAALLGDTIKTIRAHYVNPLVRKSDAEEFWNIKPSAEAVTIKFPAVS